MLSGRTKFRLLILALLMPVASVIGFVVYVIIPNPVPQDQLTTALGPVSDLTWEYDDNQSVSNVQFTLEGASQTFTKPVFGMSASVLMQNLQTARITQTQLTVWYNPQETASPIPVYQVANTDGTKLLAYEDVADAQKSTRTKGLYVGVGCGLITLLTLILYLRMR